MTSVFTFAQLGGQFNVLRHYFKGIATTWVSGSTLSITDNVLRVRGMYTGVDTYEEYVLYTPILTPSSNRYTPDHMVLDHYYVNLPSTVHINPLPIDVSIRYNPFNMGYYISLDSLNFPDWYYWDWPPYSRVWPR